MMKLWNFKRNVELDKKMSFDLFYEKWSKDIMLRD